MPSYRNKSIDLQSKSHTKVNLMSVSSGNLLFWNKMKIEKRKPKILFFNFEIKIENWKRNVFFSIFILESKLKYAKMSFSISILNWKMNGTFGTRIFNAIRAPKVSFNFHYKIRMEKDIFVYFIFISKLKILNYQHLALIKLTLIWVNPLI